MSLEARPAQPPAGREPGFVVGGRRIRRRWLLLPISLVVILALALAAVPQLFPSSAQSAQTTVWQNITSGIADGIVPKQTALEAFAYVYKVQVPDVTIPAGPDGGDAPTSGTGVMRWLQADWNQLSPAQQAVVSRFMPPETTKGTSQYTPATSNLVGPLMALSNRAGVDLPIGPQPPVRLGAPIGWPFITNVPADASVDLALAMADDMASIIVHLGPKLGISVIHPGTAEEPDIVLTLSDLDGGKALLDTHPVAWSDGHYSPCYVTAYKNAWGNAAWTAGDKVSPTMHILLTHEIVHCYQAVKAADIYNWGSMPSWMIEGTADYLAVDDTGIIGPGDAGAWKDYLQAETPLTNRTYDAMGYFALLAYNHRDLWGELGDAWNAAARSIARSDAFIGVLHGDDSDIRDNWASSYINNMSWNDPWMMPGQGAPAGPNPPLHEIKALPDPGWQGSLPSRSNTTLKVTDTSGEVVTIATNSLASVHDDAGHASLNFLAQSFCTVESCVCPPGTALAGVDVAPAHITIPFTVAVNAPDAGAGWTVIGTSLKDICRGAPSPKPLATPAPHGKCGTACGGSNGDPHLTTVNLYHYDFQAAGEFTLLRTPDGSVDIQTRQEPYVDRTGGSSATGSTGRVSINTAVAARVGSHKVGVYVTSQGLTAHVDGKVADVSAGPVDLGNGTALSAVDKGFQITLPDGTTLWALSVGAWGINVQIHPSPALLTKGQGLLGYVVPGGMGVPALPDGTRLPRAANETDRFSALYGKFADAWRITDATSLFDYEPGKTKASYTIKPYPTGSTSSSTLTGAQLAAGQSACAAITDTDLQQECVFDVGVTGEAGFAGTYSATQAIYQDSGILPSSPPTALPSVGPTTQPTASGKFFTVTPFADLGGFAQGPDNTGYISISTGGNAFSLIAFDGAADKIRAQVSVPALAPVHVAAGSVWLVGLVTDVNGHNCNITRFDAATLAQQATVQIPCSFSGGPGAVASDGSAIWFEDVSKFDGGTGKGAVMTRIDPATNAPATGPSDSLPLPFVNGFTIDSQGAFFYADTDKGTFVHPDGATDFTSLGKFTRPVFPSGSGLWTSDAGGHNGQYFTAAGTPDKTVPMDGSLVGGDSAAVYGEVLGNNATTGTTEEQLWRYPLDGSTPSEIGTSPQMGEGNFLSYWGDPMPLTNGHGLFKVWPTRDTAGKRVLLLQWTPVP